MNREYWITINYYGQAKKSNYGKPMEQLNPPQEDLNKLLEQYQNKQYEEAEKLALLITKKFNEHQFSWKILGSILSQTGRKSEALNASQTKRMIGNPNHSVSYAFGIGTAIEFSSRGDSRSSRIELPINVGSNGSNSVPYIGDNYYGGANPIPHHGLAHRVNNAGYLNDYPTYNSSTDRYKYSSATLDRAFDERQRRNLI